MVKTSILIGFVASLLFVSLIAYSLPVSAQGPDSAPGKPEVIGVSGINPGKGLIVHILVLVQPGADRNEAASAALAHQGVRPFTHDEFSTIDLFWDQFSDGDPGNDFVTQNYNPKNDPTNGNGITALLNTHNSWNNIPASNFVFEYGGETNKCPSLVEECPGPQKFDGRNDVAWLSLDGPNTLGVTWSGIFTDEADMALNTNFNWATDGVTNFDVETVYLHENGHVAGLGHSGDDSAIMYPSYEAPNRILQQDDIDGITFLYHILPSSGTASTTVSGNASTVSVDSVKYSTEGGKNGDKHLTVSVHVSGSGNNVSGALVSIQLSNGSSSWTATGTTTSIGNLDFTLKKSPSGTYTTTITNVVASGLTWDGITPPNSFTK